MLDDPLSDAALELVTRELIETIKAGCAPLMQHWDNPVYIVGDDHSGYIALYNTEDEAFDYFIHYALQKGGIASTWRRVLARNARSTFIAGRFGTTVFFDVLMPRFGTLYADMWQEHREKVFWHYAINEAFNRRGLNVYLLDRRTEPEKLVQFETVKELDRYHRPAYGRSEAHKRLFSVISATELDA